MTFEDYIKIFGVISTIVTVIVTFFNKEQKKYEELSQNYFKEVLVPYFNEYRKNNNLNSIKFIKRKCNNKQYYIPHYILYLIDNDNKQLLHKVLIVDYWKIYPNNLNNILKAINSLSEIFKFLIIFIYIISSFIFIYAILQSISFIWSEIFWISKGGSAIITIGNISIPSILEGIILLIIGLLALSYSRFAYSFTLNHIVDEYTININKINKILKRKEKIFIKSNAKYYIG
ncbi:TPA: hypothetical protein PTV74_003940 [Clostridium botulinum]|uniref:hypothetical protein n=1 Tax=Clostridium botulinum TaxID=1491 RepID=UPI000D0CD3EA|nr:hypothetical protein [Clostridium botulinum]PSL96328.1 hypothetical protein C6C12_19210 [Clostridium botulinum]HDK7140060.1 hypothetical protein [Clostridium botulinum]HDK7143648.1 hypothetical protein [Clostridium botulinum]HDK7147294.1 hypothetical protein [Clostridium botulinum]HDK7151036.1 hypothetical protein [Clostridium botulinum]